MMTMRFLLSVLLIATAFPACTERNPEFCGDGTCVDPTLPFCDVDGTFSGTPGTCIAVQCNPGSFAQCRGDTAITCNASGQNYEVLKCEMGCDADASGCVECTTNAQCDPPAVCDPISSHCRSCEADDECDSRVCDVETGACMDEGAVVYASPTGTGTCSLTQPCSLQNAYVTAANASPLRVIRMLPGTYTSSLRVTFPTVSPLKVVATDANIVVVGDVAAIVVDGGASLEIRNLSSASERQVQCGLASTMAPQSTAVIANTTLSMVGTGLAFETQRCDLDLRAIDLTTDHADILATRSDSKITADGLFVHGSGAVNSIIGGGARVTIDVVNAVFEDTDVVTFFLDAAAPGTSVRFAYSTFLLRTPFNICSGPAPMYRSVTYENSILVSLGAFDAVSNPNPANCSFTSTLLSRQAAPPSGTSVADPKFVNAATHDYHLATGSPAIDMAVAAGANPDHDIDRIQRPKGAGPDIGAYESQ